MPRRKPWDAPATLLLLYTPSPGGSLPLPSQGISSGSPGCDTFAMPCPLKQPTVYCPGVWGLHSPKANSRRWWRPEGSSAATPELSWPFEQELSPARRPIPDHLVFLDTPLRVDAVTDLSKLPFAQVPEETVVQKQPSLQPCCLIVSSFGQHESCNRTYGRTV